MPEKPVKSTKVRKPKKQKVKQGHKLVWLTLIILIIPCVMIGYILLVSARETDQPVEGNRFGPNDLNPKIEETQMSAIQGDLMSIPNMESATIDLKSATLRVHLNLVDNADDVMLEDAANQAYDIINNHLPIGTYFTSNGEGKMYDLEIDSYNYLVDDAHPADGWRFVKVVKNNAGNRVTDHITTPRNADLANQVRYTPPAQPAEQTEQPAEQPVEGEGEGQ